MVVVPAVSHLTLEHFLLVQICCGCIAIQWEYKGGMANSTGTMQHYLALPYSKNCGCIGGVSILHVFAVECVLC